MSSSKPAPRSPKPPPDPNSDADLAGLLARATPLLDVRAPVEAARGTFPGACNLPILNDDERAQVGKCYKADGHAAAEALGHRLVAGQVKAERVAAWAAYATRHPQARIMCWRGGQRSQITQTWLAEAGLSVPRVAGGYKALRRVALQTLEQTAEGPMPWWIVAGRTGVGKTVLIRELEAAIDLEGLARHRGSAFGGFDGAQPAPATFENQLACTIARHPAAHLILEDESRTIGRLALPESWFVRMQRSPLALIEATMAERVSHIRDEYVTGPLSSGVDPERLHHRYRHALQRISRRLGGQRYQELDTLMGAAFEGRGADHEAWIGGLLRDYYDPMYDYQLRNKRARIAFTGTRAEVGEFLDAQSDR